VDVDLQSPRTTQGVAAAVVLLGFVADFRFVALAAAIGLAVTLGRVERAYRITWLAEIGVLVVATILFLAGRAGWGWILAALAAGIAALAAAADVWVLPARHVRNP
jgi:hypothetical protein